LASRKWKPSASTSAVPADSSFTTPLRLRTKVSASTKARKIHSGSKNSEVVARSIE
jgi:hypothetical protein